jgi:hypothetical protein
MQKTFNLSSCLITGTLLLTTLNNLICVCVTGQLDEVKSTSGRIVFLTAHMTSLVFLVAYSAFLISSLAVQHQHLPFRDLQGLLHDGSYKLGVFRNGSNFNIFSVWGRQYLWPDYLVGVSLGWGDKRVRAENIKRVLFGNYVKVNWLFSVSSSQNKSFWKT